MSVQKEYHEYIHYGDLSVTGGISVFSQAFDEAYNYDGDDLGCRYTSEVSHFRLWAPTASEAVLLIYDDWDAQTTVRHTMIRKEQGTWTAEVPKDLNGKYYTYLVHIGDQWNEAADPYAKALGVNGDRAAILDLSSTNPAGWNSEKPPLEHPLDSIIYEVHVRDFSIDAQSGITHKGKFLGLIEQGTKGPEGISTGLDYIRALGVTHVELLPVYDFATESVDETRLNEPQYNWGYDPKNYNAPEGSYATDPYNPAVRITEMKQMVQGLHDAGLRVVMDVVYNHVYDGYLVNFTKLVPGYYLRYKPDGSLSNGSGCGNDCATERPMMRKFIVQSILHWVKEYHIDGFRFDLMGLMDIDTMNEIRQALDRIDPSILTIGEGWVMDTELPEKRRANQQHADRLPRIGQFNDDFRDSVKGDIFIHEKQGFINGSASFQDHVKSGIVGGIHYDASITSFAQEPEQNVNYAECHDNHTLWDKIQLSASQESEDVQRAMHRLASSMILTSQGIPFLHAGQEFYRTKHGVENSYKSSDQVNRMDWGRAAAYQADIKQLNRLIALRKEHAGFRLRTASEIRKRLLFLEAPYQSVAYRILPPDRGTNEQELLVLHYAGQQQVSFQLPEPEGGDWEVLFGEEHIVSCSSDTLQIEGICTLILARG
ncbi:type I pullulanase [Paenibacillus sp. JSM ZJ436]|uniref:type I pullulanase n=1 Tax=Paenibacillus sp. JSM ZJ436 TaxID=3376190 RepID=UPI0037A78B18